MQVVFPINGDCSNLWSTMTHVADLVIGPPIRPTENFCGQVVRVLSSTRGISIQAMAVWAPTIRATIMRVVVCVPSFPYSTYGWILSSSSEGSQNYVRTLDPYNGYVGINYENYYFDRTIRRVRAFLNFFFFFSKRRV